MVVDEQDGNTRNGEANKVNFTLELSRTETTDNARHDSAPLAQFGNGVAVKDIMNPYTNSHLADDVGP